MNNIGGSLKLRSVRSRVSTYGPNNHASTKHNPLYLNSLPRFITGQDDAILDLSKSIARWDERRKAGKLLPLVLSISGPTGVGKSETGES